MEQHYVKVRYVYGEKEYNLFADAGWRYLTYQRIASESAAGKSECVTLILGWPEGAGEPVYPNTSTVGWD